MNSGTVRFGASTIGNLKTIDASGLVWNIRGGEGTDVAAKNAKRDYRKLRLLVPFGFVATGPKF